MNLYHVISFAGGQKAADRLYGLGLYYAECGDGRYALLVPPIGDSERIPYSQKAVEEALSKILDDSELTWTMDMTYEAAMVLIGGPAYVTTPYRIYTALEEWFYTSGAAGNARRDWTRFATRYGLHIQSGYISDPADYHALAQTPAPASTPGGRECGRKQGAPILEYIAATSTRPLSLEDGASLDNLPGVEAPTLGADTTFGVGSPDSCDLLSVEPTIGLGVSTSEEGPERSDPEKDEGPDVPTGAGLRYRFDWEAFLEYCKLARDFEGGQMLEFGDLFGLMLSYIAVRGGEARYIRNIEKHYPGQVAKWRYHIKKAKTLDYHVQRCNSFCPNASGSCIHGINPLRQVVAPGQVRRSAPEPNRLPLEAGEAQLEGILRSCRQ